MDTTAVTVVYAFLGIVCGVVVMGKARLVKDDKVMVLNMLSLGITFLLIGITFTMQLIGFNPFPASMAVIIRPAVMLVMLLPTLIIIRMIS